MAHRGSDTDRVLRYVQSDPAVTAAQHALDEHEAAELELFSELGRAVRSAQGEAEGHVRHCDPWRTPCDRCGAEAADPPTSAS